MCMCVWVFVGECMYRYVRVCVCGCLCLCTAIIYASISQWFVAIQWNPSPETYGNEYSNPTPEAHTHTHSHHRQTYTVGPLYYKPLKCGNLYNKDTILCPSVVL